MNNTFINDFKEKANIFNEFFSNQCTPISNNSKLPTQVICETNQVFESINFVTEDIFNIINNLDSCKAHGCDNLSVRVIKICGISLCKPLEIIFHKCINQGIFPSYWKKANVVPIHKKKKKMKNSWSTIIGQYLCFQSLAKFLKD